MAETFSMYTVCVQYTLMHIRVCTFVGFDIVSKYTEIFQLLTPAFKNPKLKS